MAIRLHMAIPVRRIVALVLLIAGCGAEPPAVAPTRKPAVAPPLRAAAAGSARTPSRDKLAADHAELSASASAVAPAIDAQESSRPPRRRATLADLAAAATATEFDLPILDDGKIAAAGIRKLEGKHVVLYTDLPAAADVDELPQVFEAAVPLWCSYFGVDPAKLPDWRIIGSVMKEKEPFLGAGLYPESLPDFPHGYNVGSQVWLYDQPSAYFRRHLLLHEGTHAFMLRWLGGAGPPWYMEGMAELLGTHRWEKGQLTLGVMPASKEEVPYWGRVKIVKDAAAAGNALSLIDLMRYDAHAHLKVEAYGWCWAAAMFLDNHPLSQAAFRDLKANTRDRSIEFSKRFYESVKENWPAIVEDWQIFVAECDYGYDVPRAAVLRKEAIALPNEGATVTLATDHGWQSTGYRLEAGKTYKIAATGRYQIASTPKPWPCEAGGVTIHYFHGKPLGMLMAGSSDLEGESPSITPLTKPQAVGLSGELAAEVTGTLYFKINEASSGLADNSGTLQVTIRPK